MQPIESISIWNWMVFFELGKLVHLTDQEMDTIRFLLPHYCLFENGNRKIPVHILMSDKEKEFFGT